jgi:uncharacterized protein YigE (DUF2233 family)
MAAIRFRLLLIAVSVALAACSAEPQSEAMDRPSGNCRQQSFEGSRFTACRYDARRQSLALAFEDDVGPLRSFERLRGHLGPRAGRLLFAMNAGMFDEIGRPIGLYVEDGLERHAINLRPGPGNFHLLPNGVFAADADGHVSIVPSTAYEPDSHPRWATQSGPLLVIGGALHPQISADGVSLYVRNGVGVADANTAWFVISDEPVSFGRLARFFRDGLGSRNALYFDGAVSSLWDPAAGRLDNVHPLGPMVAVFAREGS